MNEQVTLRKKRVGLNHSKHTAVMHKYTSRFARSVWV